MRIQLEFNVDSGIGGPLAQGFKASGAQGFKAESLQVGGIEEYGLCSFLFCVS